VLSGLKSKQKCLCAGVSKVQGQKGEVQLVRIGNPGVSLLPASTEAAEVEVDVLESDDVKNSKNTKRPKTGQKSYIKKKPSVPLNSSVVNVSHFDTDQDCKNEVDQPESRCRTRPCKKVFAKRMPGLCAICGKMFSGLYEHMKLHEQSDFKCADCGRKFTRKYYLDEHRCTHSNERRYLCILCGSRWRTSSSLKAHIRMHTDERRYHCDQCEKRFRKLSSLKDHVRTIHEHIKAYQCDLCRRDYASSSGLKFHLMSHRNERPYACSMCPKQFVNKAKLLLHMVTHTGERPFSCSICGRRFTQKSSLVMHEVTQHTADGGRIYECYLCGCRFNKRTIRDAHIRRHKGIKPYTCSKCNWTFPFLGDLRNHMKKKHKVKSKCDLSISA